MRAIISPYFKWWWWWGLGWLKKGLLGLGTLLVLVAGSSAAKPATITVTPTDDKTANTVNAPAITTKTVTATEVVPFTSTSISLDTMPQGTSKVTTAGVNGIKTDTYSVTYSNGQQTSKQLTKSAVTTPPITQVTTVGTYVAPATPAPAPTTATNTYTNVDGDQIESPDASPAGATGVCNDGTYTHAVNHQGACSSHHGVNYWL
jgi:hypothetical protein